MRKQKTEQPKTIYVKVVFFNDKLFQFEKDQQLQFVQNNMVFVDKHKNQVTPSPQTTGFLKTTVISTPFPGYIEISLGHKTIFIPDRWLTNL